MLFNLLLGLILPLILAIFLFNKAPKIVLIIHPTSCILSHTINTIGVYLTYWTLLPNYPGCLSYLLYNIGLYGFLASLMIYYIDKNNKPFLIVFIFTLITTFIEFIGVSLNKVVYDHGWNLGWTFLSYLTPFILVYGYYLWLKKYRVFSQ